MLKPMVIELTTGNSCKVTFERRGQNIIADLRWLVTPTPVELSPVENLVRGILTQYMGAAPDSIASVDCGTDSAMANVVKRRFLHSDDN